MQVKGIISLFEGENSFRGATNVQESVELRETWPIN